VTQIREYRPPDAQAVVDLSLRAWTPVFASLERILGRELFTRLHGEWRGYQETAVRGELADGAVHAWVAETGSGVIGFVTAALRDPQRGLGEIGMLAVDPGAQDRGVGTALTEFATDWLRSSGMRVAMVETGGDPGHAPARRVYQKAGYTLLPVARYFKAL
jgi:GNAT superfamily N-acetyltransferase